MLLLILMADIEYYYDYGYVSVHDILASTETHN